jgi:hypothetical protein
MVQTVSQPWLLTQDGQGTDSRQLYPDSATDQRTPVIRFGAQFIAPTVGQLIGFIRVAARYQVRGRRLDPLSTSAIRNLMTAGGVTLNMLVRDDEARKDEPSSRQLQVVRR